MKTKGMNLVQRAAAPTPKFFRYVRTIGLCLTAIGGTILASPIALPAAAVAVAGYVTLAGGVMTAVAQVTVDGE